MADNYQILVCGPTTGAKLPGASKGHCIHCGAAVWIAPSGQQILRDNPGMRIVCMAEIDKLIDPEFKPPTMKQMREIEDWLRRN
jgi:hypothetical protein